MFKLIRSLIFCLTVIGCNSEIKKSGEKANEKLISIKTFPSPIFGLSEANKLIDLPLHCVNTEYPNKLGQTIGRPSDLQEPSKLHPIFYGCFDWHSAVHGYWSMVTILKSFPELDRASEVKNILQQNLTQRKVAQELIYFAKNINKSYERTYGWVWLLKLQQELDTWYNADAQRMAANLQPLTDLIISRYQEFLPKLVYPIRVGEHTNTAFGLSFAYDYAKQSGHTEFLALIEKRAREFYMNDTNCPIDWEPSGYDFLSPCLEEIDIMRRVLSTAEFKTWLSKFMPELGHKDYQLEVGRVGDRTDGKLVHLDGLNFSRAWALYGLASILPEYNHLTHVANEHILYSYPNLIGDSYEGGHWLGSFAIYALQAKNEN